MRRRLPNRLGGVGVARLGLVVHQLGDERQGLRGVPQVVDEPARRPTVDRMAVGEDEQLGRRGGVRYLFDGERYIPARRSDHPGVRWRARECGAPGQQLHARTGPEVLGQHHADVQLTHREHHPARHRADIGLAAYHRLGAAGFTYVRELVRQSSAILLEPGKEYLVESRLSVVAREEGFGSLELLIAELRARPSNGLHRKVVAAMTTNETTFFRDVHPFEALRTQLLPEMIARRQAQGELSIWCAACSTGQEPHTIAMVIREHFPALASWNVRILGSDLSSDVLARARIGRYSQLEVTRGLPATYLVEWQLEDSIRRMVEYRELNLIESWSGVPAMDLVLMRNVLTYVDVPKDRHPRPGSPRASSRRLSVTRQRRDHPEPGRWIRPGGHRQSRLLPISGLTLARLPAPAVTRRPLRASDRHPAWPCRSPAGSFP